MKENKIKSLVLLFIITLQISFLFYFLIPPKYCYVSYYNLYYRLNGCVKNNIGSKFSAFNVYTNESKFNVLDVISKYNGSIIIFSGCDCKKDKLNNWILNSKNNNEKVIYIYLSENDYKTDKYAIENKNVTIFVASPYDVVYFFEEDVPNFPIAYYVNREGIIIAKDL